MTLQPPWRSVRFSPGTTCCPTPTTCYSWFLWEDRDYQRVHHRFEAQHDPLPSETLDSNGHFHLSVVTFVATSLHINNCGLHYFERTVNVHCKSTVDWEWGASVVYGEKLVMSHARKVYPSHLRKSKCPYLIDNVKFMSNISFPLPQWTKQTSLTSLKPGPSSLHSLWQVSLRWKAAVTWVIRDVTVWKVLEPASEPGD